MTDDLIQRIEAGETGYDLDEAIEDWADPSRLKKRARFEWTDCPKPYTTSLDAVRALHEAVLPGWGWELGKKQCRVFKGDIIGHWLKPDDVWFAFAPTPELAWLAAILKAVSAPTEGKSE